MRNINTVHSFIYDKQIFAWNKRDIVSNVFRNATFISMFTMLYQIRYQIFKIKLNKRAPADKTASYVRLILYIMFSTGWGRNKIIHVILSCYRNRCKNSLWFMNLFCLLHSQGLNWFLELYLYILVQISICFYLLFCMY